MRELPTKESVNGTEFTVADFLEAGRETLQLTLIAGGGNLERKIEEPIVNRPGLALTGFYEHFAWKRLQLIGKSETAYLRSLDDETRLSRLAALSERTWNIELLTTVEEFKSKLSSVLPLADKLTE